MAASRSDPFSTSLKLSISTPSSPMRARERRHGARRDAADIGMMTARGHEEAGFGIGGVQIDRRHDGDVGQMRTAVIWIVQYIDIAAAHLRIAVDDGADRLAHRTEVHRHVRRVGDQRAGCIEQRAAEIQALLDIDRIGGVLQTQAHLFGDVHEDVVEQLQQRWDRHAYPAHARRLALHAAQFDAAAATACASQPGSTTVVALLSARMAGPSIRAPGRSSSRLIETRLAPAGGKRSVGQTVHGDFGAALRAHTAALAPGLARCGASAPGADAFHCHRLDHQRVAGHHEFEPAPIAALEFLAYCRDALAAAASAARTAAPCRCPDSAYESAPCA